MVDEKNLKGPPESQLFVRLFLSLTVGVGIGLAPFLGNLSVPGFVPLLSLFPTSLRESLIPLAAFMMGAIAVAVQLYADVSIGEKKIRTIARRVLIALLILFVMLVSLHSFVVVTVPGANAGPSYSAIVGIYRLKSCKCDEAISNLECIGQTTFEPASIETCWGSGQINFNRWLFRLLYLGVTGLLATLIGLLVLRQTMRKRKVRHQNRGRGTGGPDGPPVEQKRRVEPAAPG